MRGRGARRRRPCVVTSRAAFWRLCVCECGVAGVVGVSVCAFCPTARGCPWRGLEWAAATVSAAPGPRGLRRVAATLPREASPTPPPPPRRGPQEVAEAPPLVGAGGTRPCLDLPCGPQAPPPWRMRTSASAHTVLPLGGAGTPPARPLLLPGQRPAPDPLPNLTPLKSVSKKGGGIREIHGRVGSGKGLSSPPGSNLPVPGWWTSWRRLGDPSSEMGCLRRLAFWVEPVGLFLKKRVGCIRGGGGGLVRRASRLKSSLPLNAGC